eukprot:TRINITY_DN10531_c0_g1_i2.p1 TRINITY_DN10531_c0_g1~~TRINITY_DN10531_c0_g1_i2.p1  ORF type:complete len:303 (+),score=34.60 TRINITY_DN10531_c0_g1_i2:820-1728(+)
MQTTAMNGSHEMTPSKSKHKRTVNFTPQHIAKPVRKLKPIAFKGACDTQFLVEYHKPTINTVKVSNYSSNRAKAKNVPLSTRNFSPIKYPDAKLPSLDHLHIKEEDKSSNSCDEYNDVDEVSNNEIEVKSCIGAYKTTMSIDVSSVSQRGLATSVPMFSCKPKPLFKSDSDWMTLMSVNSLPADSSGLESVSYFPSNAAAYTICSLLAFRLDASVDGTASTRAVRGRAAGFVCATASPATTTSSRGTSTPYSRSNRSVCLSPTQPSTLPPTFCRFSATSTAPFPSLPFSPPEASGRCSSRGF